jgi:hypothetical protein
MNERADIDEGVRQQKQLGGHQLPGRTGLDLPLL